MIGLGFSLTAARGGNQQPTDTLTSGQVLARQASVGDSGWRSTADTFKQIVLATDRGAIYVHVLRPPLGAWGVRIGTAAMSSGVSEPSPVPIGAYAEQRQRFVSGNDYPGEIKSIQICHTTDDGAKWATASPVIILPQFDNATAPLTTDDPLTGTVIASGEAGAVIAPLEAVTDLWHTVEASPSLDDGDDWIAATLTPDGWLLNSISTTPGATVSGIKFRVRRDDAVTSATSDARSITLPNVPDQFAADGATLTDATVSGGTALTLTVVTLPASDVDLTKFEYEVDEGGGFGATQTTGATTGPRTITVTALATATVRLRAVSALGVGAWRSFGPTEATSGATAATVGISASRLSISQGEVIHFAPSESDLTTFGALESLNTRDTKAQSEFKWEFSTDTGDNYTFTALPADHRGRRTAGEAVGLWAGHAYDTAGTHTARLTTYLRAREVTSTVSITVASYDTTFPGNATESLAQTAVLDTAGSPDWTSKPTNARQFTSLATALTWLSDGNLTTRRRLLLKRGQSYAFDTYTLKEGCMLGAWGTGDKPIITRASSLELWATPVLDTTGDGTTVEFSFTGDTQGDVIAAYVNGVLTAATQSETGLTFETAPANAARVVGLRLKDSARTILTATGDGVETAFTLASDQPIQTLPLNVEVFVADVRVTSGYSLSGRTVTFDSAPTGTVRVDVRDVRARGVGIIEPQTQAQVRDINFVGEYDPTDPPTFDGINLSSFSHSVELSAVQIRNKRNDVSVFGCECSGLRHMVYVIDTPTSPALRPAMVNCKCDGWHNYAVFSGVRGDEGMFIGNDIRQKPLVRNFANNKSTNAVGEVIDADHGPIRGTSTRRLVINACRLDSRNSWAGLGSQPNTRLANGDAEGLGYCLSECDLSGGPTFWGGGSPNKFYAIGATEMIYVVSNAIEGADYTTRFGNASRPYVSRNNLYLQPAVPETATGTFRFFTGDEIDPETEEAANSSAGDAVVSDNASIETPLSINDTFVIRQTRAADLVFGDPQVLQRAGATLQIRDSVVIPAGGDIVFLNTPTPNISQINDTGWVLVVGPTPEPSASDVVFGGVTTPTEAAAFYTVTTSGTTQTLTFADPLGVPRPTGYAKLCRVPFRLDGTQTFYDNARTTPITLPAPTLINPLIVVEGTFDAVRLTSGGTVWADPEWTNLSTDGFARPLTDSSALTAATGDLTARLDFFGAERAATVTDRTVGCFETVNATLPSGFRPAVAVPTLSVAWSAALGDKNTLGTAGDTDGDVRPVINISDGGSPTLTAADVEVIVTRNGAVIEPGATLNAGETIGLAWRIGHLSLVPVLEYGSIDDVTVTSAGVTVPSQMSAPTLTGQAGYVEIDFAAAPDDGGSAITSYEWQVTTSTDTDFSDAATTYYVSETASTTASFSHVAAADRALTVEPIGPLAAGDYIARSRAVSVEGAGAWSTASSAATVTAAPAIVKVRTDFLSEQFVQLTSNDGKTLAASNPGADPNIIVGGTMVFAGRFRVESLEQDGGLDRYLFNWLGEGSYIRLSSTNGRVVLVAGGSTNIGDGRPWDPATDPDGLNKTEANAVEVSVFATVTPGAGGRVLNVQVGSGNWLSGSGTCSLTLPFDLNNLLFHRANTTGQGHFKGSVMGWQGIWSTVNATDVSRSDFFNGNGDGTPLASVVSDPTIGGAATCLALINGVAGFNGPTLVSDGLSGTKVQNGRYRLAI